MVGEPDGVPLVKDGDDDLGEPRMYEVLRHLADNGVGNRAARHLRLLVDFRSEVLDEVRRGRWLDLGDARRAAEVVVLCYARNGLHIGIVERTGAAISGFIALV